VPALAICVKPIMPANEGEIQARGQFTIRPISPSLQLSLWSGALALATHLDRLAEPIETLCIFVYYVASARNVAYSVHCSEIYEHLVRRKIY
jgi:hypothetical protein